MKPLLASVPSFLGCLVLAAALAPLAAGAVLTITNTNDSGAGSLRQAVADADQANGGDTIVFNIPATDPGYNAATGTFTIALASQISINTGLTIAGPGADRLTITLAANARDRFFFVAPASTSKAVWISGVTFANGRTPEVHAGISYPGGGAIFISPAAMGLTVADCTFSGNVSDDNGGAIDNYGTLNVVRCRFSRNSAGTEGGAIGNFNLTTVTVTATTFSENSSYHDGGAIFNGYFSTLNAEDCTFDSNQSGFGDGGAIYNTDGYVTIGRSTVRANQALGGGGAIVNAGGTMDLRDSTLNNNRSSFDLGGAIVSYKFSDRPTVCNLVNSTFAGNRAAYGGGAIQNGGPGGINAPSAVMTVVSCTISGNLAPQADPGPYDVAGGGIGSSSVTPVQIVNSIVAGNAAAGTPDVGGIFSSQGYNLIGAADGSSGFVSGAKHDQAGTAASPVNPLLGPLADNGGPTQTMALLPGSPAINAGSSDASSVPQRDQRAYAHNGVRDIGAFEFAGIPLATTAVAKSGSTVTVSFYATAGDFHWLERKGALLDREWQLVPGQTGLEAASDGFLQLSDSTADGAAAFYRVILNPEPDTVLTDVPPPASSDRTGDFRFGTTKADLVTFQCSIDDGPYTTCTSPFATPALAEGAHTFRVRATDSRGLTDRTPAAYTWTVDSVPPTVMITSPTSSSDYTTTASSISLGGTAGDTGTAFSVSWTNRIVGAQGTAAGTTAWSVAAIPLAMGNNVISVTTKDAAGNIATDTLFVTRN